MATLVSGVPHRLPYTPSSAVTAGDVIVLGDLPCIAPGDIAADQKSALDVGGACYTIAKEAAVAYTAGVILYWDDTNDNVTSTASTHEVIGYAAEAALAADTTCLVYHKPAG